MLASLFPRLRRFWLGASASDATTEAGLEALAGGLPQLTRLELMVRRREVSHGSWRARHSQGIRKAFARQLARQALCAAAWGRMAAAWQVGVVQHAFDGCFILPEPRRAAASSGTTRPARCWAVSAACASWTSATASTCW